MIELIAVGISALALMTSGAALYVVNFWRGKIKCSKPVKFFFGYGNHDKSDSNISVHCFIHSTGIVGQVIDHVFLEVEQGESKQRFTSWSAGSHASNRMKLAGFKIPRDGHSIDFIFATPPNENSFKFSEGEIAVTMYVRLSGSKKHKALFEERFVLDKKLLASIDSLNLAVFELGSTGEDYNNYTDKYETALPMPTQQLIETEK